MARIVDANPLHVPALDRINRRTYRRRATLRQFENASGWLDAGERVAIGLVAPVGRGDAILDIGVGGGRTAPLMRDIGADYHGIDYVPEMVAISQRRFPELDFQVMDARRLEFADQSFRVVAFSYNGIDSVDLAGRRKVLQEVARVLMPGGYFVFSALNRQQAGRGERWPDTSVFRGVGRSPTRLARALVRLMLGGGNWLRYRSLSQAGPDAAVGTLSAHRFGLIAVFTTVDAQIAELHRYGFVTEAVVDPSGRRVAADGESTTAPWHYFVARKRMRDCSDRVVPAEARG